MKQQNKILSIRIHEIINRKQVGQYTIVKLKKLDASLPTSLNQIQGPTKQFLPLQRKLNLVNRRFYKSKIFRGSRKG